MSKVFFRLCCLLALLNCSRSSNVITFHDFISLIYLPEIFKFLLSLESDTSTYNCGLMKMRYIPTKKKHPIRITLSLD